MEGLNKKEEIKKDENKVEFSKELQDSLTKVREMIQCTTDDVRNLLVSLENAKIPYSRYYKDKENRPSDLSLTDRSMYIANMSWQIENFDNESVKNDPRSLLKVYEKTKEAIDFLQNKFKIYGYHDDRYKGGDILSKDYPEIANQIDSLSDKFKEIQEFIPEIKNRLDAQEKFKAIKNHHSTEGKGDYIPSISFIDKAGDTALLSHKIGFYRTPEELINNSEKYIEVLRKNIEDFKDSEKYSDDEKDVLIDTYEKSISGISDYLDEFKKLN